MAVNAASRRLNLNSTIQVAAKMLSQQSGVSLDRLKNGRLNETERTRYSIAAGDISEVGIYVCDQDDLSAQDIADLISLKLFDRTGQFIDFEPWPLLDLKPAASI